MAQTFAFVEKLRQFAAGYKTYAVGLFLVLYAAAQMLGVDVPQPGDQTQTTGFLGLVILFLRYLTTGPAAPLPFKKGE